ncbi:hypothetical protein A8C56_15175 [Niabella ginsenosidivorans]|uniref:Uncharacterized protein n=1 Tax=Niabella ginsenosidivorans TaxID=1176587 RepID=A0A1A9I6H1_9BACT|nr:hypothetical protein [Niabella ginsenosidivorans]ANH82134.1 hypothetical protein A8C56_15175 [Niabella ginsenosidivorans]
MNSFKAVRMHNAGAKNSMPGPDQVQVLSACDKWLLWKVFVKKICPGFLLSVVAPLLVLFFLMKNITEIEDYSRVVVFAFILLLFMALCGIWMLLFREHRYILKYPFIRQKVIIRTQVLNIGSSLLGNKSMYRVETDTVVINSMLDTILKNEITFVNLKAGSRLEIHLLPSCVTHYLLVKEIAA